MTRARPILIACRMLAPSAGLPDSSYTTRYRRPPARGGPTIYDGSTSGTGRPYIVGPPLAGGLRCRPVTGSQHTASLAGGLRCRPVTGSQHTACHEKVTGTCHSERSEESEVGHAARLVRPDASLPLSMTREGAFFTACYEHGFL